MCKYMYWFICLHVYIHMHLNIYVCSIDIRLFPTCKKIRLLDYPLLQDQKIVAAEDSLKKRIYLQIGISKMSTEHTYMYVFICMYVCKNIRIHINQYIYINMYEYMYVYIHIYIYIYIYI